jgi:hypothetical protein
MRRVPDLQLRASIQSNTSLQVFGFEISGTLFRTEGTEEEAYLLVELISPADKLWNSFYHQTQLKQITQVYMQMIPLFNYVAPRER